MNLYAQTNLTGGTLSIGSLDTKGTSTRITSAWTGGTLEFTNCNPSLGSGAPLGTTVTLATGMTLRLAGNSQYLRTLSTGTLNFTGGKLDLKDKKLIAAGGSIVGGLGTWNGTNYNGVTGLVASGRNGGAWNGNGIITSMTHALSPRILTTLAVATANEIGKVGQAFLGQTLASGDVIVMYTYGGDANLDGRLNGDDYFQIDGHVNTPNAYGWHNGDFDYNGHINGDDYFIIDSNFNGQTLGTFSTSGSVSGVTPIPEPAGMASLVLTAGGSLCSRRRARRRRR